MCSVNLFHYGRAFARNQTIIILQLYAHYLIGMSTEHTLVEIDVCCNGDQVSSLWEPRLPRKKDYEPGIGAKGFDDLPVEIFQKHLFMPNLEICERLCCELVCKRWKQWMPYRDSCLDVFRTYVAVTEMVHQLNGQAPFRFRSSKSADQCRKEAGTWRLWKCIEKLVVKRNMGAHLLELFLYRGDLNVSSGAPDLYYPVAKMIIDSCSKLQRLQVKDIKISAATLRSLLSDMNMHNLKSLELSKLTFYSADEAFADFELLLRRAVQLKQLTLHLPSIRFQSSAIDSVANHSLTQLSIELSTDELGVMHNLLDLLPIACPALEDIEIRNKKQQLFTSTMRLGSFIGFENLRTLRIDFDKAPFNVMHELYKISRHFALVKCRPIESIRLGHDVAITSVADLNSLCKIEELAGDLNLDFSGAEVFITQAEFDVAISGFSCSKIEILRLTGFRFSPESQLLPVLGIVAGRWLKKFYITSSAHQSSGATMLPLSNVNCWRNFVQNCEVLTEFGVHLDIYKVTAAVFAELGRSRSLQSISLFRFSYTNLYYSDQFIENHMKLLAETRINEGIQHLRLIVQCKDALYYVNTNCDLAALVSLAGIEVICN